MTGKNHFVIEVQSRYRDILSDRWPITVSPLPDELLSSWLHRLAFANGVAPLHFAEVLSVGKSMWSARMDICPPEAALRLLHQHSNIEREALAAMTIEKSPRACLLLPLRIGGNRKRSTWLQFCPKCLASDEAPYFRRSWRQATRISCWTHGCGFRDRCPSCGQGMAGFQQQELVPHNLCTICGFDLRASPNIKVKAPTRRLERYINDLCHLDATKGFPCGNALAQRLLELPAAVIPFRARSLIDLPTAERIRCLDLLLEDHELSLGLETNQQPFCHRDAIKATVLNQISVYTPLTARRSIKRKPRSRPINLRGISLSALVVAYMQVMSRRSTSAPLRRKRVSTVLLCGP